jgi:predicted transcriptional regulator
VSKLKIHVGDSLEAIGQRVKHAVRRDRSGERVREYHLTFDSFETLAKVLTPRRLELLRHVHKHPAASIRALAQALGRDYRRVHDDVEALAEAGLLQRADAGTGVSAPFDAIETRIAL